MFLVIEECEETAEQVNNLPTAIVTYLPCLLR